MEMSEQADASEIAQLLNHANQVGLRGIVDEEALREVINDYFVSGTDLEDDYSSDDEALSADQEATPTPALAEPSGDGEEDDPHSIIEHLAPVLLETTASEDQEASEWQPCKCKRNGGKPCFSRFSKKEIEARRLEYLALTQEELDIAILAKIDSFIHLDPETQRAKQSQTPRLQQQVMFMHQGHSICRDFFMYLHNIKEKKLKNIYKQYRSCGVEARIHKLTKQGKRKGKGKTSKKKPEEDEEALAEPRVKDPRVELVENVGAGKGKGKGKSKK